jgi:hypothetical protein
LTVNRTNVSLRAYEVESEKETSVAFYRGTSGISDIEEKIGTLASGQHQSFVVKGRYVGAYNAQIITQKMRLDF